MEASVYQDVGNALEVLGTSKLVRLHTTIAQFTQEALPDAQPNNDYYATLQHSMSKSDGCQLYSRESKGHRPHLRLLPEEL